MQNVPEIVAKGACKVSTVPSIPSLTGMPSLATAFFTRAMGRKRPRASSREAPPLVASTCRVFSVAWEFLVFSCVSLLGLCKLLCFPFAVPWIP
jgi:hypothetical protein